MSVSVDFRMTAVWLLLMEWKIYICSETVTLDFLIQVNAPLCGQRIYFFRICARAIIFNAYVASGVYMHTQDYFVCSTFTGVIQQVTK